jgi:hypothetical protein
MPYLAKIMGMDTVQRGIDADDAVSGVFKTRRLERMYLDTSAVYVFSQRHLGTMTELFVEIIALEHVICPARYGSTRPKYSTF